MKFVCSLRYIERCAVFSIERQFCKGEKIRESFGSRLENQNTHQDIYICRHRVGVISFGSNYDKTDINCAIIIVTMHFIFVWNVWQTSWESFWPMSTIESFPTHDASHEKLYWIESFRFACVELFTVKQNRLYFIVICQYLRFFPFYTWHNDKVLSPKKWKKKWAKFPVGTRQVYNKKEHTKTSI